MADIVRMCRISWNWISARKRLRGIMPVPSLYARFFLFLPKVVTKVDNDNFCWVFLCVWKILAQPPLAEHMCTYVVFNAFCPGFRNHSQYGPVCFSPSECQWLLLSLSLTLPLSFIVFGRIVFFSRAANVQIHIETEERICVPIILLIGLARFLFISDLKEVAEYLQHLLRFY